MSAEDAKEPAQQPAQQLLEEPQPRPGSAGGPPAVVFS